MPNEQIDPKGREILPCPFCGEKSILKEEALHGYFVACLGCQAYGPISLSRSGAVAAWNRRENREAVQHAYTAALQRAAGRVREKAGEFKIETWFSSEWVFHVLENLATEIEEDTTNATDEKRAE